MLQNIDGSLLTSEKLEDLKIGFQVKHKGRNRTFSYLKSHAADATNTKALEDKYILDEVSENDEVPDKYMEGKHISSTVRSGRTSSSTPLVTLIETAAKKVLTEINEHVDDTAGGEEAVEILEMEPTCSPQDLFKYMFDKTNIEIVSLYCETTKQIVLKFLLYVRDLHVEM